MATTDINGMVFYTVTDPVEPLQTLLNGISTATTNALNAQDRVFKVANQAARDTLYTQRGAPLTVSRTDTGIWERNTGSGWRTIAGENWTPYTPTLTNATLGNGTITGEYSRQSDGTVVCAGRFTLGTTSALTATALAISLPISINGAYNSVYTNLGNTFMQDTSTSALRMWFGTVAGVNVFFIRGTSGETVTNTVPWTWASGDVISWNLIYRGV